MSAPGYVHSESLHSAIEFSQLTVQRDMSNGFRIYRTGDSGREHIEHYIRQGFFQTHCANVQSFLPVLLAVTDASGRISGALGYRPGGHEAFFLERYLDQPLEATIARRCGRSVERRSIVEIGNLVCRSSLAAKQLMWRTAAHLHQQHYLWAVFTGTRAVRSMLQMFQAPVIELANATEARAGSTGDEWGSYYNSDPRVVAGYLPAAFGSSTASKTICGHGA